MMMKHFAKTLLLLCLPTAASANSFIGIGQFQSEFFGSEFDRSYESDVNTIRQLSFGYRDRELAELFGDVRLDEDNKVRDFALGLAIKEKLIRIERGKISGQIVDEDGPILGTFNNEYRRIDIIDRDVDSDGFMFGMGVQQYSAPHLFEYNDGSTQGPMLQDDQLSVTSIGIGVYYDPIYNYMMSDKQGFTSDWYFSTSTLAISLAYAKASDAEQLKARGVDKSSWFMWGNSGTYELGWFWGHKAPMFSAAFNIGYHIRANTFFNLNPAEFFADEADPNDIALSGHQTILHGPAAALNISF